ncbi:MAG TPA: ferritin-like domain-containing protein [Kofleriaceae bacterium]|nr:ferritin-like domain-containing protein [Kofleriaceae bacterium]
MNTFKADLEEIRRRARDKMEEGAVTASYGADREKVIEVLNEVLATEIVCTLRYKNHYYMAHGIHAQSVAAEFLEHAQEEEVHVEQVAKRITELNGRPNFNPDGLKTRSHAEYAEGETLDEMIREDLVAERIAIATYSEIIRWLANDDPTTRRMIEEILAKEEEHADDLANLLGHLGAGNASANGNGNGNGAAH